MGRNGGTITSGGSSEILFRLLVVSALRNFSVPSLISTMKLEKVLKRANTFQKRPFINIISSVISNQQEKRREINDILNGPGEQLKDVDDVNISKIFSLVAEQYQRVLSSNLIYAGPLVDIAIDILIRDGNCIMSREWFGQLFESEHKVFKKKIKEFKDIMDLEENSRVRDYKIYHQCVHAAFVNDLLRNRAPQITSDEKSILVALAKQLDLSSEEVRLIECISNTPSIQT